MVLGVYSEDERGIRYHLKRTSHQKHLGAALEAALEQLWKLDGLTVGAPVRFKGG